jgi:drug/metabolite transporter (DMT)-like permease
LSQRPHLTVVASAVLFGLSTPLAKLLLRDVSPIGLAGLLYLGSFAGLSVVSGIMKIQTRDAERPEAPLRGRDAGWLAGAIVSGGIAGPIGLMFGLSMTSGTAASLLLNLEGAATAGLAVLLFREHAGRTIWAALGAMTLAGIFLSWDPTRGHFALGGSLLIIGAMFAWGLDNNLTRAIADRDPVQIARIKGLSAGLFSSGLALATGSPLPDLKAVLFGLVLGAFAYGASLVLFIRALRHLGAFRTGAFFSFAPFIGAGASLILLGEPIRWVLLPGLAFMGLGVFLLVREKHEHAHRHRTTTHTHAHAHDDGHHDHGHEAGRPARHAHEHAHDEREHSHGHWPDLHHRHPHD